MIDSGQITGSDTQGNSLRNVLVGTCRGRQLEEWEGWYNYPISTKDNISLEDARKINELWVFQNSMEPRCFDAEFIGVKTRAELVSEYAYPAKGKAHGDKYLLFKTRLRYMEIQSANSRFGKVILRLKDFVSAPKVRRQLKEYLESPERDNSDFSGLLPDAVMKVASSQLFVCDNAYQLSFWDLPEMKVFRPKVPFPPPEHPIFTFIDLFNIIYHF